MEKKIVNITKATISFVFWEILFEIIFFMLIGFFSGLLTMIIDNETFVNIIMIIPRVIVQVLVIKFAIWNTFKKQIIESYNENKFLIIICIIYIVVTVFSIMISFNLANIIGNIISLMPLSFHKHLQDSSFFFVSYHQIE